MKYLLIRILLCLFLAGSMVTALSFHLSFWPFELLVSFANYIVGVYVTILLLCFSLLIYRNDWASQTRLAIVMVMGVLTLYSLYFSLHTQPVSPVMRNGSNKTITFTTFNREFSNDTIDAAAQYLKEQNIDVLALQETNPSVTESMSQKTGLAHYYNATKLNMVQNTSTAIISRYEISEQATFDLSDRSSLVRVVIDVPEKGQMAFYSLHLSGPFSPNRYQDRLRDGNQAADIVSNEKLPTVLGGDFNTTIYSPSLQHFNKTVSQSMQSTTVERWPECSRFSNSTRLCLRIDHTYIPKSAQLVDTYISSDLGSDHRALTVRFSY